MITKEGKKETQRAIFFKAVMALIAFSLLVFAASAFGKNESKESDRQSPKLGETADAVLQKTPDAGIPYQNKLFFFGESTTAHLARKDGVLEGSRQVLKDGSGTKTLSLRTPAESVNYVTAEGETMKTSFENAIAREKPEYLVLSFGLNGITSHIHDRDGFLKSYQALISAVKSASPQTKIILQSVYPINRQCGVFSVDADTVNSYIRTVNGWIVSLAASEENVKYADTASVLTDGEGMLKSEYDNGDGHHLTDSAYTAILFYLRTHAY